MRPGWTKQAGYWYYQVAEFELIVFHEDGEVLFILDGTSDDVALKFDASLFSEDYLVDIEAMIPKLINMSFNQRIKQANILNELYKKYS